MRRFASCSGDQSLKIWNVKKDSTVPCRSVHANEPITSFVFCGNPTDAGHQKLVVSSSYAIRIYKLRTLGILHTIQFKDLKANKTPITFMQTHPLYDNYILLSSDNQLRLFDLSTETTLRVFSTRHIESGVRIEGRFSPTGQFVYCGNCDVRGFSSNPYASRSSGPKAEEDEFVKSKRGYSGLFIWRVQTGKLEMDEMRAMTDPLANPSAAFIARW